MRGRGKNEQFTDATPLYICSFLVVYYRLLPFHSIVIRFIIKDKDRNLTPKKYLTLEHKYRKSNMLSMLS